MDGRESRELIDEFKSTKDESLAMGDGIEILVFARLRLLELGNNLNLNRSQRPSFGKANLSNQHDSPKDLTKLP